MSTDPAKASGMTTSNGVWRVIEYVVQDAQEMIQLLSALDDSMKCCDLELRAVELSDPADAPAALRRLLQSFEQALAFTIDLDEVIALRSAAIRTALERVLERTRAHSVTYLGDVFMDECARALLALRVAQQNVREARLQSEAAIELLWQASDRYASTSRTADVADTYRTLMQRLRSVGPGSY
jgi:hypothetical protein